MLGRTFDTIYDENPDFCWINHRLKTWIEDSNFVMGNLETTVTNEEQKFPNKAFNFKISPKNFERAMKCLRIDYLNLANNHSLDYMVSGLEETIQTLDRLGISHTGASANINDVQDGLRITVNGLEIIIFSVSTHPKNFLPYVFISTKLKTLISMIKQLRENFKGLIIISIHWGSNYMQEPDKDMKKLGRKLIDAGANIIHGTSPHHPLPFEIYNNGFIFYSLGDFIDDYIIDRNYRNDLSAAIKLKISSKNEILSVDIIPTRIYREIVSDTDPNSIEYSHVSQVLQGLKLADQF